MDTPPTNISDHTLETLLSELVSGRTIIDVNGGVFSIDEPETRNLLNWFRQNRRAWEGQNRAQDVLAMIGTIDLEPPSLPMTQIPDSDTSPKRYRLSKVRVCRFGGLHDFGEVTPEPDVLELDFRQGNVKSMLFYGRNGSGKSSLISAICWCLCGWYYQPQHSPVESTSTAATIDYDADHEISAAGVVPSLKALPIVPMPPADKLTALKREAIPTATWVEVELIDNDGITVGPFRRTASLTRGRLNIATSGNFSQLQLSPADLEVGTRLPAMLPHIRLDEKSGLGDAVAKLIDIQPLVHVSRHSGKSIEKIEDDLIPPCRAMLASISSNMQRERDLLRQELQKVELPKARPLEAAAVSDLTLDELKEFSKALEDLRGESLQAAKTFVGEQLDVTNANSQKQLIEDVIAAESRLDSDDLSSLPGIQFWNKVQCITSADLESADKLLQELTDESALLNELHKNPDNARRIQLYAKVANWLRDHEQPLSDTCPVCDQDITSRVDPITTQSIRRHLEECLARAGSLWEQSLANWSRLAEARLSEKLSSLLGAHKYLSPVDALLKAFATELIGARCFQRVLAPIIAVYKSVVEQAFAELANHFAPPVPIALEGTITSSSSTIQGSFDSFRVWIAMIRWAQENPAIRDEPQVSFLGVTDDESGDISPLRQQLHDLRKIVNAAAPLTTALDHVSNIEGLQKDAIRKAQEIAKYERAIKAFKPLLQLDSLVKRQVDGLLQKLKAKQDQWLKRIYVNHRRGRPEMQAADLSGDGRISFKAKHNGTVAAAHRVSNSSYIRASLVAFWLAYWEYQLAERGGLQVMLFDDPQDLFDDENQLRFARAVAEFNTAEAQVVLATHKYQFFSDIGSNAANTQRWEIDWQPPQPCVGLLPFKSDIEKVADAFRTSQTDPLAQEYAAGVRVFVESRLTALFRHDPPGALTEKPTLSVLGNMIRHLASSPPFDGEAFIRLVAHPGLNQGTDTIRLLNDSHHARRHLITAGSITEEQADLLRSLVKAVQEAWDHFHCSRFSTGPQLRINRGTLQRPPLPAPIEHPDGTVRVITSVAAAGGDDVAEDVDDTGDEFAWSELGDTAVYQILGGSLGFSAPKNYRVIVSLDEMPIQDKGLVIALSGDLALARRYLRIPDQSVICLSAEHVDPRRRPPLQIFDSDAVRLLPIIGVIWDDEPPSYTPPGEAFELKNYSLKKMKIKLCQHVKGPSAVPLVLDGQQVLLGEEVEWADLGNHIGQPMSVELEDDGQLMKLVGSETLGPRGEARLFQSIGGLGESYWVRCKTDRKSSELSSLPVVRRMRRIRVVLYEAR